MKSLPLVPSATPPPHVLGAWLFICRQLYNTGEGLLVLEPFQLHLHIARAHKIVSTAKKIIVLLVILIFMQLLEAKEGLATAYGRGQQPLEVLEECLVDNLLNFAGTPKVKKKFPCLACSMHSPILLTSALFRAFCCYGKVD